MLVRHHCNERTLWCLHDWLKGTMLCLFNHDESHIFYWWAHIDHMLCLVCVPVIPHDKGVAWIQRRKEGLFFFTLILISSHSHTSHFKYLILLTFLLSPQETHLILQIYLYNTYLYAGIGKKGFGRLKGDKCVFETTLSPLRMEF